MENINKRITKELQHYHSKNENLRPDILQKKNLQKMQLYSDYEIWIGNLKISMHMCKYRKVIAEIEAIKHNFKILEELHWKYQYIEIDAIFKILKKKILTHTQDIVKESAHHQRSCYFWFNQIFLILEQLLFELRPDLNKKLDYNNEDMVKPVQCIIDGLIKFSYLLLLFAQFNQQIPDLISYLSIMDKMIPYMLFTDKGTSYIYIQKIQLFKVKILAENCEFITAVNTLEENIDFCLNYIQLFSDDDYNAYVFDLKDEQRLKYQEYLNKRRLFKMFQDSGFKRASAMGEEDDPKMKAKDKVRFATLSAKKIKHFNKLNNKDNKENKDIISPKKILRVKNTSSVDLKKISSNNLNITNITNTSNKNDTNNNNKITKKVELKGSKSPKKKSKQKKLKSNKQETPIIEETKKKNLFLTQLRPVKTLKQMEKGKKQIMEEILNNIALNFYLRAAIFEHVGNIDSALDSYKEVEWFSIKFLIKKFPQLSKYMISLLNCAWNNYNVIYKLRLEKDKRKQKNEIIKSIEQQKMKAKLEAEKRHTEELIPFKSSQLYNNKKLNNFLNNLGNKIYKEEEQRNFNIYNRFTKTGFILSTYKVIDDLLSDDLKPILKRMKKIEITKQNEEIKDLMDKALIKKQQNVSLKETTKSTIFNKNNMINTKVSSINVKESSSCDNKKREIRPFSYANSNIMNLKKKNQRSKETILTRSRLIENTNKNFSSSCEMTNKGFRNINTLNLYNENSKKTRKILINKTRFERSNISSRRYNNYRSNNSEILKVHPGISTLRSSIQKEKVRRIVVDKDNFSKSMIRKKTLLDKFSSKEFGFLRDLLKSKYLFPEVVKPIDDLGLKKVRQDADLNFNTKLEIAKSGRGKKNLNNLIKQNINMVVNHGNQKSKTSRTVFPTDKSYTNYVDISDNNERLKKLENDCIKINSRRRILIKRRKKISKVET